MIKSLFAWHHITLGPQAPLTGTGALRLRHCNSQIPLSISTTSPRYTLRFYIVTAYTWIED